MRNSDTGIIVDVVVVVDDDVDTDADTAIRSSTDQWRRFTAHCIHWSAAVSRSRRLRYAMLPIHFLSLMILSSS